MTHTAFHFAVGLTVGTLLALPRVMELWSSGDPLYGRIRQWILLSNALGILAVVPAVLVKIGLVSGPLHGWGWNIFLLYTFFETFWPNTTILGAAATTGLLGLQYIVTVAAVFRARART